MLGEFNNIAEALDNGYMVEIVYQNDVKVGIIMDENDDYHLIGYEEDIRMKGIGELKSFLMGVLPALETIDFIEKEKLLAMLKESRG
jgi:hypothetical protein